MGSSSDWCGYDSGQSTITDTRGYPRGVYVSVRRDGSVWLRFGRDHAAVDPPMDCGGTSCCSSPDRTRLSRRPPPDQSRETAMLALGPELTTGPFYVTRSNPTHQLTDMTQPNPAQPTASRKIWTQPDPTKPTATNRFNCLVQLNLI